MASWLIHIYIASNCSNMFTYDECILPFMLGNVAPDYNNFSNINDRKNSHFKTDVSGEYKISEFLGKYIIQETNKQCEAFYWGYLLHLIVDKEWANQIYIPFVKNKKLSKSDYQKNVMLLDEQIFCNCNAELLGYLTDVSKYYDSLWICEKMNIKDEVKKLLQSLEVSYKNMTFSKKDSLFPISIVKSVIDISVKNFKNYYVEFSDVSKLHNYDV